MDAIECIRTRMSVRGFLPEPVPRELFHEIFDTARWSPSYKNTQPWEAVIVSGGRKDALSRKLIELLESGAPPKPDLPEPGPWPAAEQARIDRLYRQRAEATGMDLNDPEVIRRAKKANFRFYGAPHAIYLYQDASLSLWSLLDMGLFAQSLMLAAHAKGLGTVPQAFVTDYADEIRKFLGIPDSKRLILGLSIGYPDRKSPANRFRTDRAAIEEIIHIVE